VALEVQDPLVGTVVAGRYRILARIAAGGMGVVYRAEHTFLKHEVVIKRLHRELTSHEQAVARFTREAQAAVRIDHPNVCRVFDCGTGDDGAVYIAMELLQGQLLSERIAGDEILPLSEIVDIGGQLCDALERAHALGIVHRDLKPDNVMLVARTDGVGVQPKIMDFGVAKLAHDRDGKALTQAGMVFGTPKYMAPEQAAGEPLDTRADLYALGVMLFEMATGRAPFEAATMSGLLMKQMTEPAPMLEDAAPHLAYPLPFRELVARCLVKDPNHRIQTAAEVGAALRACAGLRPSLIGPRAPRPKPYNPEAPTVQAATGPGTPPRTDELLTTGFEPLRGMDSTMLAEPRRVRWPVAAAAAAGLLLAVGGGLLLLWTGDDDDRSAPADAARETAVAARPPQAPPDGGAAAPDGPDAAVDGAPPDAGPDAPVGDAGTGDVPADAPPLDLAEAARAAAEERRVFEAREPVVLQALSEASRGNVRGGVELLLSLADRLDPDAHYHFELAVLLARVDRLADAVQHALRALVLDPRYAGSAELHDVALRGLLQPASLESGLLFVDLTLEPHTAEQLVEFVLANTRAVSTPQRVRELLERRGLLDGVPEYLRLPLLVIATEDCTARRALLDRIAAAPDARMVPFLARFRAETGCGRRRRSDCWPCERTALRAALAAVQAAPAGQADADTGAGR
jgi:serine/threonine-protein kinase